MHDFVDIDTGEIIDSKYIRKKLAHKLKPDGFGRNMYVFEYYISSREIYRFRWRWTTKIDVFFNEHEIRTLCLGLKPTLPVVIDAIIDFLSRNLKQGNSLSNPKEGRLNET